MTIHVSISMEASDLSALVALLSGSPALSSLPISISMPPAAETAPVAVLPQVIESSQATPSVPHPHKGINRYPISNDELRNLAIEQLRKLAVAGVAPTTTEFDHKRPEHLPTATGICKRLKISWLQMATDAGLVTAKMKEAGITAAPFRSVNGGGQ